MSLRTRIGPIWALATKDLRHLARDRGAAFFTLAFPLLIAIFFGLVFGRSGDRGGLSIVLVDEDQTKDSASFAADIRADPALDVKLVAKRSQGEEDVRLGRAVACVIIPKGFAQGAEEILSGGGMSVEALVDPTKDSEAGLLTGKLNELAFKQMSSVFDDQSRMSGVLGQARAGILSDQSMTLANKALFITMFEAVRKVSDSRGTSDGGADLPKSAQPSSALAPADSETQAGPKLIAPSPAPGTAAGWRPVNVTITPLASTRAQPLSGYELSFTQGVVWGLMGAVTAFGTSLSTERSRGTLTRLIIGPVTRGQVLAGKALACFLACMGIQAMLMIFGVVVFKIRIESLGLITIAALASALGFTGVMLFIAGLTRSEGGGSGMGRALVLVLAMIGGGTVPIFVLPSFMQTASKISPFTWASACYEGAIWRGFGLADMAFPALVLVSFGVVGFAIGTSMLKWGE